MKLYDLVQAHEWFSVEITMQQLYPDQNNMLEEYKNVFETLKNTKPTYYDELEIILTEYDYDPDFMCDKETYIVVSGQKKVPDLNAITQGYALEFLEWDKWLGMDLAPETIQQFSDLEIIMHCLYEMTFIDFDEESIQEQLKSLNKSLEEFINLTDEEKQAQTFSLEELKQRIEELNNRK